MCFPVTDVNNQPKLQFPTPFPQTFASFHKISTWQHTKKWNTHVTLHQRTKPGGIFGIYSSVFSPPSWLFILFHWHIRCFFLLPKCCLSDSYWRAFDHLQFGSEEMVLAGFHCQLWTKFCQRTKATFTDRNVPLLALACFPFFLQSGAFLAFHCFGRIL